jgi:cytochrome b subunit of formate dehydrogenase
VAARVALTSHLLDRALAAITLERLRPVERAQTLWLLCSAVLVLAGGIALMLLLELAVWLFLASAAGQALYLAWLAPRYFDAADPPDAKGCRQTANAFVIYTAATAFVVWASYTGRLAPWQELPWPLLALAAAAVAAHAGYVAWMYGRPLASSSGPCGDDSGAQSSSDGPLDPPQGN